MTSTGCETAPGWENSSARPATSAAPRISGAKPARAGADVSPQHDVRIQQLEQRGEVPGSRGGQEGVHHLALAAQVGVRPDGPARTRWRARLASICAASGVRPTIGPISLNGTPNRSCKTNASRSAGVSVSSTTSSARPTASAVSASRSGSAPS